MDFYRRSSNVARTCRHFGISRQTFYRWFRRYDPQNLATLEERSQGMKSVTHLLDESRTSQTHAEVVSCDDFSDIVPSHYGGGKLHFHVKGALPWRGQ